MTDLPVDRFKGMERIKSSEEILENLRRDLYYSFGIDFDKPGYQSSAGDPEVFVEIVHPSEVSRYHKAQKAFSVLQEAIEGYVAPIKESKHEGPEEKPSWLRIRDQNAQSEVLHKHVRATRRSEREARKPQSEAKRPQASSARATSSPSARP